MWGVFSYLIATYLGERKPDAKEMLLNLKSVTLPFETETGVTLVEAVFYVFALSRRYFLPIGFAGAEIPADTFNVDFFNSLNSFT